MQIDILEQLSIVARDAQHEVQVVMMGVCFVAIAVCLVILVLEKFGPFFHKLYKDFLHLDGFGRVVTTVCIVVATMYGGAKHARVDNAGADAGITLEGVYTDYDSTNDLTSVEVKFNAGNVTAATPVSVRMAETNEWTTLVKIDPTLSLDVIPKILSFGVAGNVASYRYWWVGDDRPAIVVESSGINITRFAASSTCVAVEFTCDDPKATTFSLQTRVQGGAWETVATVERADTMAFAYQGFTINQTREWRVRSEYTEGD